jgi:hypothetical protein
MDEDHHEARERMVADEEDGEMMPKVPLGWRSAQYRYTAREDLRDA